jgi:pilus assembly protein CpaB
MSARSILLIAAALLLTVGTVFVARNWLENQKPGPAPVAKKPVQTEVLVARTDLPTGTFINEQHVRWQVWPDDNLPESYLVKSKSDQTTLFGSVLRRGIATGQPIVRSQIIKPGDRGFLAAVLKPGHRAYTIKINAASAIAGLVFPGDRIDLILTQKVNKNEQVSETILSNLRILAIDQSLNDQTNQPRVGKTATFEVTPKQSEILAVAGKLGQLSLSLRSLAKTEAELERLIATGEALEETEATRGGTYTRDSEASILRSWSGAGVNVVRGGKAKEEKADK